RAITLVREESGALPVPRGARVVQIAVTDASERIGADLLGELRRRLTSDPKSFTLDPRSTEAEISALLDAASGADAVLLCLFIRTQSGKGTIGLPQALRPALERILALPTRVVVVSFGTPYLLRDLPSAKTYLAAYGSQTDAQVAVAHALFGEAAI